MDVKNKENVEKFSKMTLSGYYENLSKESPRGLFVKRVAKEAGVTETAVVGWCKDGRKPHKYEHVVILSKYTGIKPEDLWAQ